jgi:hypothetical protein
MRKAAVAALLRSPLTSIIGTRLDVVALDVDAASVLIHEIEQVFDGGRVRIAVALGEPLRPNRKPVLCVMTEQGHVLGYVKIGWNALTKRLVSNEANVLRAMSGYPPTAFRVPRVLHEAEIGDAHLTVLSPLPHSLWRRGRLGAPPPFQAVREVAFRQRFDDGPLAGSEYERAVHGRIAAVADPIRRSALAGLFAGIVETSAAGTIAFGAWHGDWTPWNLARTRTGLQVWDWERSGGPVPVGMDPIHHRFLFGWRGGGNVERLASDAIMASRDVLVRLGVDVTHHQSVLLTYLFELLLRFEEGRAAGLPTSSRASELQRFLESETTRARR